MAALSLIEQNSSKDIVLNCLLKARKNGYKFNNFIDHSQDIYIASFDQDTGRMVIVTRHDDCPNLIYQSVYLLFFETRFAKAFFGAGWEALLKEMAEAVDKYDFLKQHSLKDHAYRLS